MKVFELMSEHIISVGVKEPVSAAARLMRQYNIGAVPVCDDSGRLRGMITDRDITVRCTALGASPDAMRVSQIMTRGAITVDERAHIGDAARLMSEAKIRRLPVCRDGVPVGMLSLGDLARSTDCDAEAAATLSEISQNIKRI